MKRKVGVIGLGEMGLPMARNLLKAGFRVAAFDVNQGALEAIEKKGAQIAGSCRDLAQASEIVLVVVRDSRQVERVMSGDQGVLAGADAGSIIVIMSTVEPMFVQKMAAIAELQGLHLLDAPISGAHTGAESGTLTIMVGGAEDIFGQCQEVFNAMGSNIFHLGEVGAGECAKLINNLLLFLNICAVYEGLPLAEKAGLDIEVLFKLLKVSTGDSWVVRNWPMVSSWKDNYQPKGTLDLIFKDLGLIMSMAENNKVPLFLSSLAKQMLRHSLSE